MNYENWSHIMLYRECKKHLNLSKSGEGHLHDMRNSDLIKILRRII